MVDKDVGSLDVSVYDPVLQSAHEIRQDAYTYRVNIRHPLEELLHKQLGESVSHFEVVIAEQTAQVVVHEWEYHEDVLPVGLLARF